MQKGRKRLQISSFHLLLFLLFFTRIDRIAAQIKMKDEESLSLEMYETRFNEYAITKMWEIDCLGRFHYRRTICEFFDFVRQHGRRYTLNDIKGLIGEPLASIWDEKRNGCYVAYPMYREPKLPV